MLVTILIILSSLVLLIYFITRLSLEIDTATGERVLRRSSLLGRYYNLVTRGLVFHPWENLTNCRIVRRVLVCTAVKSVILGGAIPVIVGFFIAPYWVFRHDGIWPNENAQGSVMFFLILFGVAEWITVALVAVMASLVFGANTITGWIVRAVKSRETDEKNESLVMSWLRAKKEKTCFRVRVED